MASACLGHMAERQDRVAAGGHRGLLLAEPHQLVGERSQRPGPGRHVADRLGRRGRLTGQAGAGPSPWVLALVFLLAGLDALFADRPLLGLLLGLAGVLAITLPAAAVGRSTEERSAEEVSS
jgi:hypothetical protein